MSFQALTRNYCSGTTVTEEIKQVVQITGWRFKSHSLLVISMGNTLNSLVCEWVNVRPMESVLGRRDGARKALNQCSLFTIDHWVLCHVERRHRQ